MMAPAVILLLIWMIVPLAMTLYFSFLNYNLLNPAMTSWAGWFNYSYFYTDPAFFQSIWNTLLIVGGVLLITIWKGEVGVAEHLGADTFVHVNAGELGTINVRASGEVPVHHGDTVYLTPDPTQDPPLR